MAVKGRRVKSARPPGAHTGESRGRWGRARTQNVPGGVLVAKVARVFTVHLGDQPATRAWVELEARGDAAAGRRKGVASEAAPPVRRVIGEPLAAREAAALAAAESPVVVGGVAAVLVEAREVAAARRLAHPFPDVAEATDGIALARVCVWCSRAPNIMNITTLHKFTLSIVKQV